MNKKGEVPWYVIQLVLALGVLVVILFIFNKPAAEASRFFSSKELEFRGQICLNDAKNDLGLGKKITDSDGDGLPDYCDICVNGKNTEDGDGDRMPTHCDKDDDDRTVVVCSRTLTKDERCIG